MNVSMKDWRVTVVREGRTVVVGQVSETTEALARCAALSRYGVTEDEVALGEAKHRDAAIYPDEGFEVTRVA